MVDVQALFKKAPKDNPIILVYEDGFVDTRHNNVFKGNLAARKENKRPILILYPEQLNSSEMLKMFEYAVHPVKGKVLEYKKPRFVGEIDES